MQTTPFIFEPKPENKDGEADIAVAVINLGGGFNAFSATLLTDIFRAYLRRKDVQIIHWGAYCLSLFAVNMVTVPVNSKADTLEAIRETLSDLNLSASATIAAYSTDARVWVTIDGPGDGGTDFADVFLRQEYLEQAKANSRAALNNWMPKAIADLKELHALFAKGKPLPPQ